MHPGIFYSIVTHNVEVHLTCPAISQDVRMLKVATNPNGDRQCFVYVGYAWFPFGTIVPMEQGQINHIAIVNEEHIHGNHPLADRALKQYRRILENLLYYTGSPGLMKFTTTFYCRHTNKLLVNSEELKTGVHHSHVIKEEE